MTDRLTDKEREWLVSMPSWADYTNPDRGFVNGDAIIEKFDALSRSLATYEAALSGTQSVRDDYKVRAAAAEQERDDLLRQRLELQNSLGRNVVDIDELCREKAEGWGRALAAEHARAFKAEIVITLSSTGRIVNSISRSAWFATANEIARISTEPTE